MIKFTCDKVNITTPLITVFFNNDKLKKKILNILKRQIF